MEVLNAELQLQSGEADVTKGLLALNIAQDQFEALAALRPNILGATTGTVTTSASTEKTAFPAGVLRIDRLHLLNSSSLPSRELMRLQRTGGHATTTTWPLNILISSTTGDPVAYWTNGTSIYWNPLPSGTATVRWYGFKAVDDITAAGTFAYPDVVALPLAAFAAQLMRLGVDDDVADISSLATGVLTSVLDTLAAYNQDGAVGFAYTQHHIT